MQGPSWIALFERIPVNLHDSLGMTLVTGEEILMQSVLRLESDFMLLRGRMSGSTDAGRVLVIPYDQIVNLAFTKRMLVPEVQAVFGQTLESPDSPGSAEVRKRGKGHCPGTCTFGWPRTGAASANTCGGIRKRIHRQRPSARLPSRAKRRLRPSPFCSLV